MSEPAFPPLPKTPFPSQGMNLPRPSGRSRLGKLPGFRVAATGSYLPPKVVTNDDLASLGCDSEWIIQRTGIRERHQAEPGVGSSDLAWHAVQDCLARADISHQDVDLIVVATMTPDFVTPSTACMLQRRLGCIAPAFDINCACSGFMYALVTAAHFLQSGMSKKALVVGSEIMSHCVNPKDPKTYPLFGDGAGAVLIVPTDPTLHDPHQPDGLLAYSLGAEGCGGNTLCIPGGGSRTPLTPELIEQGAQFLHMDGRAVFKWAIRTVEDAIRDVLHHADRSLEEVTQFILHQANTRILQAIADNMQLDPNRISIQVDRVGNTSAASIPLALHDFVSRGSVREGDLLLLCGFGAGLTWGAGLLRW